MLLQKERIAEEESDDPQHGFIFIKAFLLHTHIHPQMAVTMLLHLKSCEKSSLWFTPEKQEEGKVFGPFHRCEKESEKIQINTEKLSEENFFSGL